MRDCLQQGPIKIKSYVTSSMHLRSNGLPHGPADPGSRSAILSHRLQAAQNSQIWTALVFIGIEPAFAQNGGSVRVHRALPHESA